MALLCWLTLHKVRQFKDLKAVVLFYRWAGQPVPSADDSAQDRCWRRVLPVCQHMCPLPEAAGLFHRRSHEGATPYRDQGEGVPSQLDLIEKMSVLLCLKKEGKEELPRIGLSSISAVCTSEEKVFIFKQGQMNVCYRGIL